MVERRKAWRRADRCAGADKRRDYDRGNTTSVHVEVETVCRVVQEITRRWNVWTRRNCRCRNRWWDHVIVYAAVFVVGNNQERRLPVVTVPESVIELQQKSIAIDHVNRRVIIRDDNLQIACSAGMIGVRGILVRANAR